MPMDARWLTLTVAMSDGQSVSITIPIAEFFKSDQVLHRLGVLQEAVRDMQTQSEG